MSAGSMTAEPRVARPMGDIPCSVRKRAYKLARSGACKSLTDIGGRLTVEGYSVTSIDELLQENIRSDLARIISLAESM